MARAKAKSASVRKPKAVRKPVKPAKKRPVHFFKDPNIDRLLEMVMNLAAEIAVMRDRLDTHERLSAKGAYTSADVEAYDPAADVLAAREEWRKRFLDRLLKSMEKE